MTVFQSSASVVILIILASLGVQIGFAVGMLGPAWLSPILSLPALGALAWLWRRAEKQRASSQAFAQLVI